MFSLRTKIELVAVAALLVLGGVGYAQWRTGQAALQKAEANQVEKDKIIQQASDVIQQSQATVATLQKNLQQTQADKIVLQKQLDKKFSDAKTAQQIASLTEELLKLKAGQAVVGGTPEAPTITTPAADLKAYEQSCEQAKLDLKVSLSQFNYVDQINKQLALQLTGKDQQIGALTSERDQWRTAAKGGSKFWKVTKEVGKIGGALTIGYLAGRALK